MKKYFKCIMLFIFLIYGLKITAQESKQKFCEKPFIEVYGTAEKEIVPNEIYLEISIKEREYGRNKINIKEQDIALRTRLKSLGVAEEEYKFI